MTVPHIGHLAARLRARFHAQVQVQHTSANPKTPGAVPVKGRVVRVFRSGGALKVGDEVEFSVHVCRRGDDFWEGPSFMPYETFMEATYMEVYLNGNPPRCEVALDEHVTIETPTRRPQLKSSRFAYVVESLKWKFH
jgi:hypothetical protein